MAGEQSSLAVLPLDADALYRSHARSLYAFILSKVGNRETAEDITGDVFVKALTHLDPAREEYSIVAWLYRVARNAVTNYWRAAHGVQIVDLEEARLARQAVSARDEAHHQQAALRARALLNQLPERYRVVLTYRLLEGLSVRETAQRMATSEANVKVLQYRALKRASELRHTIL